MQTTAFVTVAQHIIRNKETVTLHSALFKYKLASSQW